MSIIIERNLPSVMRDGCVLRVNVFRPSVEGRYPVLVFRTPYDKNSGRSCIWRWIRCARSKRVTLSYSRMLVGGGHRRATARALPVSRWIFARSPNFPALGLLQLKGNHLAQAPKIHGVCRCGLHHPDVERRPGNARRCDVEGSDLVLGL